MLSALGQHAYGNAILHESAQSKGKSAQNRSPDPSRGPSGAIFHPGSVFDCPGAGERPPGATAKNLLEPSKFEAQASRIEVRGFLALGGRPRRHGRTQREKRVRLDPGRGPGTDFEPIFSFQCLNSPSSD